MGKLILIDEIHVTVLVSANLPNTAAASVIRTLKSKRFQTSLRRAVVNVCRSCTPLRMVKIKLSR